MAAFHFELVSPEQLLFSGEVESVAIPGIEGQMTILKDHAPVMTTLKPGVVEVAESASKTSRIFVRGSSSTPPRLRRKSRTRRKTWPTLRATKASAWRARSSTSSPS